MYAAIVLFRAASAQEIMKYLTERCPKQAGPPWIVERSGDAAMYVSLYEDDREEFEPDEKAKVEAALGGPPTCSVICHLSGRHFGQEVPQSVVLDLLDRFDGVAVDEYSDDVWTREVIRALGCFFTERTEL